MVFTLYELEKHKEGSAFIRSKVKGNNFVICVTKNKTFVIYDTSVKKNPMALEMTFFGYSRMTNEITNYDYAKRLVRKFFKEKSE